MSDGDHDTTGPPADESSPASRFLRVVAPIAAGLVIVIVAIAIIIWLPLDAKVEVDVKEALVGYEVSREVAWPATKPFVPPLSGADQAALAAEAERGLSRYAAGDALAGFDASRAVSDFVTATTVNAPWVVTNWDGEIVHFDFVRQTMRGDVLVRAGVRRAHQVGRSSTEKQRVVARRWDWDDGADIFEYTLRDDGDTWRVVAATHWGVCGPEGDDVVEGGHAF